MGRGGFSIICLSLVRDVSAMSQSASTYFCSHLLSNSANLVGHLIYCFRTGAVSCLGSAVVSQALQTLSFMQAAIKQLAVYKLMVTNARSKKFETINPLMNFLVVMKLTSKDLHSRTRPLKFLVGRYIVRLCSSEVFHLTSRGRKQNISPYWRHKM